MNILPRHLDDEDKARQNELRDASPVPFFLFLLTLVSIVCTVCAAGALVLDSELSATRDLSHVLLACVPALGGSASSGLATWSATLALAGDTPLKGPLKVLCGASLVIAVALWGTAFSLII